jgi:hypothetical protein
LDFSFLNKQSMKIQIRCLIAVLVFFCQQASTAQSVSINDDASLPHSSAILDLKVSAAAKKGFLVPRMTSAQRAAIASPAKGLLVYDSTSNSFWFHNGTAWTEFSKGINPWTVNGTNVYNLPGSIGIGVSIPKAKLNVVKNQNVLFGESMSGVGTKMFWNGTKGALRAGLTESSYPIESPPFPWDNVLVGEYSLATGINTEASGYGSVAFGQQTKAQNYYAIAGGTWTRAGGWNSFYQQQPKMSRLQQATRFMLKGVLQQPSIQKPLLQAMLRLLPGLRTLHLQAILQHSANRILIHPKMDS